MDGKIVTFPGAEQPPVAETDIETRHAEAFRDLDHRLMDCVSMSKIAFDHICEHKTEDRELVFAVAQLWKSPEKALKRLLRLVCRREAWWIAHVVNLGAPIGQKA